MSRLPFIFLTILTATTPALAQDVTFVSYSISNKRETVKGSYSVEGYTPAQIVGFISQDCAGAVGPLTPKGNPRKKRGITFQKYTTTCSGGLAPRYKGSVASFEVQKQPDGRHLVEILTSDGGGNAIMLKEIR